MGRPSTTLEEKFETKILREKGEDPCWVWTARTSTSGHGLLVHDGKTLRAPAVALLLYKGVEVQKLAKITHKCSNNICVAPGHLSVSPRHRHYSEWSRKLDPKVEAKILRLRRGRNPYSLERISKSLSIPKWRIKWVLDRHERKLARAKMAEDIRRFRERGETIRSLAERYDLSTATIDNIVHRRKNWATT